MGQKQRRMSLKCLRPFFDLTARPTLKISNFCVYCPIWMRLGMVANNEPETT